MLRLHSIVGKDERRDETDEFPVPTMVYPADHTEGISCHYLKRKTTSVI